MADCVSQPRQMHEQQTGFGHTWKRGTQGPDLTNLYPANTRHGEVMGQR